MVETTELPTEVLIDHVVAEASEYGDYTTVPTAPEEFGGAELDWDLSDVDDWDVDVFENGVTLSGLVEGTYAVQTASATRYPNHKAHPAEYETRTTEMAIEVTAYWGGDELWEYEIEAFVA